MHNRDNSTILIASSSELCPAEPCEQYESFEVSSVDLNELVNFKPKAVSSQNGVGSQSTRKKLRRFVGEVDLPEGKSV